MALSGRFVRLALLVSLAVGLNLMGHALVDELDFQVFPRHEPVLHLMVLSAAGLYVMLMAIPFMPGIEIGLALLLLLGGEGALLVYMSTVLALSISYWVGRLMPERTISRLLQWLHFHRAAKMVMQVEEVSPSERIGKIYNLAPAGIVPFLLRHRFLAVAALLNLPGNALIGGGGGISLVLGMSRLIPYYQYLLTVALAVAPVPLLFYILEL
ncbi:hypothetical protein MARLIPOL_16284 [Marinobacter lipolyticus SM19]|uniref:Uncharacterized protein n=1 Tax=Marinobacter lipolyticus SM19 TaxID=1318628 RepID=R8AXA9_9GAMM|nr:hypothetical protein [Marinobacter lipolyticus]EON90954.1 hypothetical protein MARLIPOL_16284 [Marinobacter lipolyticus SM19]